MLSSARIIPIVLLIGLVSFPDVQSSDMLEASPDDNSLWMNISNCKDMDCLKAEFSGYLRSLFEDRDVRVTSFLNFRKNDIDYNKWESVTNKENQSDSNRIKDEDFDDDELIGTSAKAANPLEEVIKSVQDKIKQFFVTHDVELSLPEFIAEGASVRMSPKTFQDGGALIRLDLASEAEERSSSVGTPRIFLKRISKFIGERLLWALGAILLIVKLLSLKFMFFLPVIVGVAAAKKLLLKVILFIFPFLGHLFKLCPYYAPTKYHHHHHQISHLHHLPPHLHDLHAGGVELDHKPQGWSEGDHGYSGYSGHSGHHHHHEHGSGEYADDLGYYSDGPGFGSAEIGLRRKQQGLLTNDEDDLYPNHAQPVYPTLQDVRPHFPKVGAHKGLIKHKVGPLNVAEIENMVLKAEKEAMLKARLQEEQKRVEVENKLLQDKIKNSLKLQEKLKIQSMVAKQTSKIAAAYQPPSPSAGPSPSNAQQLIQPQFISSYLPQPVVPTPIYTPVAHHQPVYNNPTMLSAMQSQLQNSALNANSNTKSLNPLETFAKDEVLLALIPNKNNASGNLYDSFYSPILTKIDKIFNELLILDENCRERLVCNMYSEPEKYSPHSNLISAELSRDASELQKPATSNSAVIRFYKYVQAARDGQDKRECSALYPSCSLGL